MHAWVPAGAEAFQIAQLLHTCFRQYIIAFLQAVLTAVSLPYQTNELQPLSLMPRCCSLLQHLTARGHQYLRTSL